MKNAGNKKIVTYYQGHRIIKKEVYDLSQNECNNKEKKDTPHQKKRVSK